MDCIKQNINKINARIAEAADKSGRAPSDVTLVAVTKNVSAERINRSIDCGIKHIGENKAQEFLSKLPHLKGACRHFIGNLQKNKVRQLVGKVSFVQSVDSSGLAWEIDHESEKKGVITDVLLEINIAGEFSKHGFTPSEAGKYALEAIYLPNIRLRGLMTVAPLVYNPEENRDFFKKMFEIYIDINEKICNTFPTYAPLDVLSMGMTGDFAVAVEEMATMVRIGTGIYGERNTSKV